MCNILALMWYWPWNASNAGSRALSRRRARLACPSDCGSSPCLARTRASVARFVAPHAFSAALRIFAWSKLPTNSRGAPTPVSGLCTARARA